MASPKRRKKTDATRCAKIVRDHHSAITQSRAPGSARIISADPDPGETVLVDCGQRHDSDVGCDGRSQDENTGNTAKKPVAGLYCLKYTT
ncbi:MAG: hypothetical protein MI923_22895 [Phycisphaerales bacterium]|nr:hypothetical protein [Phycisphaerales bacterium]